MLFTRENLHLVIRGWFAFLVLAGGARAQDIDQHRFVSGNGKDTNPCVLAAPCRTFQRAVSTTSGGDVVVALDSAEYGEVSISHAVSIQAAPGVYAGILVESRDGVTIEAGSEERIVLRGLTIHGGRGATPGAGITFRTGGALHIEHCRINGNFALDRGISADIDAGALFVNETTVRECAAGIVFDARQAVIDSARLEDNRGVSFIAEAGNSHVTINDSISAGNGWGFS